MYATDDWKENMRRLAKEWADSADEMADVTQLLAWISGNVIPYSSRMMRESKAHDSRKPVYAASLVRYIITQLSYLYATEPKRAAANQEAWERILWRWGPTLSAEAMYVDETARLCGTAATVIDAWSSELPDSFGLRRPDGLRMITITPDMFRLLSHKDDYRTPGAMVALWGRADNGDPKWMYYDATHRIEIVGADYDNATIVEHGYDVMPVAVCRNTLQRDRGLYGLRTGGRDLLKNLTSINRLLREIGFVGLLQRGQPVIVTGSTEAKNVVLAPDAAIEASEVGGFYFAQNSANVPMMIEALNAQLEGVGMSVGLPPGGLSITTRKLPDSPLSVAAINVTLEFDRTARERRATDWEMQFHQIGQRVWSIVEPDVKLDWRSVLIEYPRIPVPLTNPEKLAEIKAQREMRLIDRKTAAKMMRPAVPDSVLDTELEEAHAEWVVDQEFQITVAGHAKDLKTASVIDATAKPTDET